MFCGTMIDELIRAVERVERESHVLAPARVPVSVTRYSVNPGFVYAMQFTEPVAAMGVA